MMKIVFYGVLTSKEAMSCLMFRDISLHLCF